MLSTLHPTTVERIPDENGPTPHSAEPSRSNSSTVRSPHSPFCTAPIPILNHRDPQILYDINCPNYPHIKFWKKFRDYYLCLHSVHRFRGNWWKWSKLQIFFFSFQFFTVSIEKWVAESYLDQGGVFSSINRGTQNDRRVTPKTGENKTPSSFFLCWPHANQDATNILGHFRHQNFTMRKQVEIKEANNYITPNPTKKNRKGKKEKKQWNESNRVNHKN